MTKQRARSGPRAPRWQAAAMEPRVRHRLVAIAWEMRSNADERRPHVSFERLEALSRMSPSAYVHPDPRRLHSSPPPHFPPLWCILPLPIAALSGRARRCSALALSMHSRASNGRPLHVLATPPLFRSTPPAISPRSPGLSESTSASPAYPAVPSAPPPPPSLCAPCAWREGPRRRSPRWAGAREGRLLPARRELARRSRCHLLAGLRCGIEGIFCLCIPSPRRRSAARLCARAACSREPGRRLATLAPSCHLCPRLAGMASRSGFVVAFLA